MRLRWCGSFMVALCACGPQVDPGGGGATDTSDESSDSVGESTVSTTASMTVGTTGTSTDPSTTGPTTVTATTDPSTTMTTDPSTVSTTDPVTTDPTDPTGGTQPNGAMCNDSSECMSGHCFVVGILGGLCGECETDDDCPGGGCSLPNPLANPPYGSVCNDGGYGSGCMGDDVCADGLVCATVIDVPGVLTASTCGECTSDAECDAGFVCAPDIAVASLTGVYRCVAQGSLANGQSCEFAGSGDASCVSGHCAIADVMGLLQIGVCSECEIDAQCGPMQTCEAPQVDLMSGLIAGTCV